MARIEWIKCRLNNWGRWKAKQMGCGNGWATQSAFLAEPGGGYRQTYIPFDDVEAGVTDQAVESLKAERRHLYDTLQRVYPEDLSIREAAREEGVAESTIHARLDQADIALREWINARNEKK